METKENGFRSAQNITNRIMFISIIVMGSILFVVSGKNFWQNVFAESGNPGIYSPNNRQYDVALAAGEEDRSATENEDRFVQLYNDFESVTEPEIRLDQIPAVKAPADSVATNNDLLAAMYVKKNNDILNEVDFEHRFRKYLVAENEASLEVEPWITTGAAWEFGDETAPYHTNYVEDLFATDVYSGTVARLLLRCGEYLAPAAEAPLELEAWMTDERCWCPGMRQQAIHETGNAYALGN